MNKKIGSVFTGLAFVVFAAFLAVEGAEAFCVYNKTDKPMNAVQTSGGNFGKNIPSGGKECCNWQEKSCNKGGKKDSTVRFKVYYQGEGIRDWGYPTVCEDFPIKAGGWLTIEGSNDNYKCVAHE